MAERQGIETGGDACCPLPPGVAPLPADGIGAAAPDAERLAAAARALADPVRLRMLSLMVEAAAPCCAPPAADGPTPGRPGVCVCEFQGLFGLAQSTVSHHLRVLREAGLVREERRGKWTFYRVDEAAARGLLDDLARRLGLAGPADDGEPHPLT